jgi:hypothetical protein
MQFGLLTLFDFFPARQNETAYYQDTLDLMIYAEKLGFDSVWVGEEHFYPLGRCGVYRTSGRACQEPWRVNSSEFLQQRFCLFQVHSIKPFGEPTIDLG